MLVNPKRRKVLRYKEMREIGLDDSKIQFLFILDNTNFDDYDNLCSNFNNEHVQVNVFTTLDNFSKKDKFNYFSDNLDILFELCDTSFLMTDDRILSYDYNIIDNIDFLNKLNCVKKTDTTDEVCIILAHCDTWSKKEILIENITALKKQNQKIILSSHIPVSDDILQMVDYFVCDKKNEMITPDEFGGTGRTYAYIMLPGYHHQYYYDNHAFAVLQLMIQGVNLSKLKGFKISHLIHYDTVLYDKSVLTDHTKYLEDFDIVHYYFKEYPHRLDGNFFSINNDLFLQIFYNIKEKSNFINYGIAIFEEFLKMVCSPYDEKIKSLPIENLFYKNIVDKIKMLELNIRKFYTDEIFSDTYITPLIDANNQKYVSIITNDGNINKTIINDKEYLISPQEINVFSVNEQVLNSGINVEIPYLNINQKINNQSKFANLLSLEPDLVCLKTIE